MKDSLDEMTFAAFRTPLTWQREAKSKAQQFVADHEGNWLLACGASGSGKTHLCTAVAGEFLKAGNEVRYMLWQDESVKLKACVTDDAEYERLIAPLKAVKVLYIDDFFKAPFSIDPATKEKIYPRPTAGDVKLAYEILNSRGINQRLITIISTERTPENLLDIDEALGSRIYAKSKKHLIRIEGEGKNWRLKA